MSKDVLLIDDSVPLHRVVESCLSDNRMQLHSAFDAESGLKMATIVRPCIILLDLDLPDMDGFEVCRRLKGNNETAPIPVLFLTADATFDNKMRGFDLGAIDCFSKPFNANELCARVQKTMQMSQLIEGQSGVDGVTGLLNMAYLTAHIHAQLVQSAKLNSPVSCIVADLDSLRQINTRYGRQFGDEVLRTIADQFLNHCRPEDVVCSLGKGRFSIILTGTDRKAAGNLANKLCGLVRSKTLICQGVKTSVTCSFGVADTFVAGETSLMDRAQEALRLAKQNGRGRVSVSRPFRKKTSKAA